MIRLVRLPSGGFDVAMDDQADVNAAVATVVYALLFTDQRAPLEREPDHYAARGWWAGPEAGSGLWHVRRQALSPAAREQTLRMVREALEREPSLSGVSVAEVASSGNVSGMQVLVSGQHNERQFLLDLTL